jgi:hypothetical protein
MLSTERQQFVDSPWTCLCFTKQLCLFIVYILLLAVVGVLRKLQTLVHGEEERLRSGHTMHASGR